jgi:hypothetical protein
MDLSEEIAWLGNMLNFGDILTKRDRSSRSGPVRSFPIRMSVDGSSQRGECAHDLTPLASASSVGRRAEEQWSVTSECKAGIWRSKIKVTEQSQFPGSSQTGRLTGALP